jgi:hypothetical protein
VRDTPLAAKKMLTGQHGDPGTVHLEETKMVTVAPKMMALAAKAVAKVKALFLHWIDRMAESRMQKIRFENEMYRGMYRYSSKNDDDLPIVR